MTPRRAALLAVTVLTLAGCHTTTTASPPPSTSTSTTAAPARASTVALRRFDDCPALLGAARRQARDHVTEYGLDAPGYGGVAMDARGGGAVPMSGRASAGASAGAASSTPAPAADAGFSGTNLQESGVDEPDVVKNDGRVAYRLDGSTLRAIVVGADGALRLGSTLALDVQPGGELLKTGDDVVVLAPTGEFGTRVIVVDARNADALRIVHVLDLEGHELSAREVGGIVRLVVTQNGPAFDFTQPPEPTPAAEARALAHNRAAVDRASLAEWLPDVTVDNGPRLEPAPPCGHVYLPPTFSGPGSTSVLTISASDGKLLDATSVLATASEVYASPTHLYVATSSWPDAERTEIHRFDISDPARAVYEASGEVAGHLLRPPWFAQGGPIAQWSLSERDGDLRVATTTTRVENAVTVLRRSGPKLVAIGRVGAIAPGEQLYAVRFIGTRGYVVTYKKVDPLFVLDLADPEDRRVLGQLSMPGYSAYLHPLDDDHLLGVGQDDTNGDGLADGTQVSVFDVHDPAHPRRVAMTKVGDRGTVSGTESDPRTFTWWERPARAVLTVTNFQDPRGFRGAVALEPSATGVREVGRLATTCTPLRTRVMGDSLVLFSTDGVQSASIADLAPRSSLRVAEACAMPMPGMMVGRGD